MTGGLDGTPPIAGRLRILALVETLAVAPGEFDALHTEAVARRVARLSHSDVGQAAHHLSLYAFNAAHPPPQ